MCIILGISMICLAIMKKMYDPVNQFLHDYHDDNREAHVFVDNDGDPHIFYDE